MKCESGKPYSKNRQVGTLTVGQVEDLGALVMLELLDLLGGLFSLGLGFALFGGDLGVLECPDGLTVGGVRHHSRRENHQVHLHLDLLAGHGVLSRDDEPPSASRVTSVTSPRVRKTPGSSWTRR